MEIRCLGPLEASEGLRPIPLGGPRQRLVLAHLLVRANQNVPADRLIDEVWGSRPPPAARSSLQSYVSHLRRALGPDRIDGHGRGYALHVDPEELDVARASALAEDARRLTDHDPAAASATFEAALTLWRGPPFADLADEPSLQPEIARLEELRRSIVDDRIAAELARGRGADLVGELEALTSADPLRERTWAALMLALYRGGRQAAALAAYDRARRVLVDELGIEPSAALQQLHTRILRHDPTLLDGAPGGASVVHPAPPRAGVRNPYKGLRAFAEADAPDFFGREALTARLVTRLRDDGPYGRFLAVVGPSGSGKSSVVRAGLVPVLRAGALPGSDRWTITELTPGDDPFRPLGTNPFERVGDHDLLVVIDQFEELFTLVASEEIRRRFLAAITEAVTDADERVRVVVTLRADLYDRPLGYPGFAELVRERTEAVVPLAAEELERAVRAPAERVGVRIEPALVTQIVSEVTGQPGALPLLQYALTELFDRRGDGGLTATGYTDIGGVSGALARRAEEVYAGLTDVTRAAARQLFLRLVAVGEGVEDTRRRVTRAELDTLGPDPGPMAAAIDAFGAARLLTHDRDPSTRAATVEVTHESLLRAWRRLRSWTDAARDDLRLGRRVATATTEWIASGRDPSFLLTGARLERVEAWRERSGLATTSDERDYLDTSLAERDRREAEEDARREREDALTRSSHRRLRALLTVSLIAALVAASLTVYGFRQRDLARLEAVRAEDVARAASARELSASAMANLEADPERSVLLALEAIDRTRNIDGTVLPEAEEALHAAVGASRITLSVPDVGGALSWSPDGDVFVTEGPEDSGVIDIRDAATGVSVRAWHGHDIDVNDVAFSPDGSMLATVGDDGAARIWDPADGEQLFEVTGEGQVWHVSWDPDGSHVVATWPDEGVVRVIDPTTGDTTRAITDDAFRLATSFSADGQLLAIAEPEDAIHLYDVTTGDEIATLPESAWASEIASSPDGRWIAAGDFAGNVTVWDVDTRESRFTLYGGTDVITSLEWSPGSDRLLSGSGDGRARLYEISSTGARETMSLSATDLPGIQGVAFSPDGDQVMLSDRRITAVQIHDVSLQGASEWATFPAAEDFTVGIAAGDGDLVVATGEETGTAAVWDVPTGERSHVIGPHDGPVLAIADAPDAGLVTTAGGTTIITSDDRTWETVFTLEIDGNVEDVAWNPDGSMLAAAVRDGPIQLIDRSGNAVRSIEWGDDASAWRIRFSPDGRYLGALRLAPERFDPAMPMLRIWDLERDEVVATVATQAETFAFHPDGDAVATGQLDGDIEIWEILSGRQLDTLVGHNGIAITLAYGPDGSQLVSGGSDATVRLWDVVAGVQRVVLQGHQSLVYSVDVSADGSRVVSGDAAGVIRVWALDIEDLITIAEDGLTRSLTDDECRQYLHVERCP